MLSFIKERLPEDLFSKVEAVLPGSGSSASASLSGESGSGLLGKAGGLVGNLLGGSAGDMAKLFEAFSKSGMTLDQAKAFLPAAIALLKDRLPEELVGQILSKIPGLGDTTS